MEGMMSECDDKFACLRRTVAASLLFISVLVMNSAVADEDVAGRANLNEHRVPIVAPIGTAPGGQTYGRWAAEWWQWALGVPAATNPISDTTGEHCAERQVDDTWFLGGVFDPVREVIRECTVPAGKALFFPIINSFLGQTLDAPPEERTEEFVREGAKCQFPVELHAEIDGFEIKERRLLRFTTGESGNQYPIFNVQLPPGNVFGVDESLVPELVASPSAEEGYYLYLLPLASGEHEIHWQATGCFEDPTTAESPTQDITYLLTVDEDDDGEN
jgi:hypothetical protein